MISFRYELFLLQSMATGFHFSRTEQHVSTAFGYERHARGQKFRGYDRNFEFQFLCARFLVPAVAAPGSLRPELSKRRVYRYPCTEVNVKCTFPFSRRQRRIGKYEEGGRAVRARTAVKYINIKHQLIQPSINLSSYGVNHRKLRDPGQNVRDSAR